ncbi:putative transporter SVOPL [Bombyx mori]|uniref:Major facilitator superfamily (MFS) profile domain-containing protein n=2 Tax=Bombyx mori TaxID=7091 RepID=A0A8R2AP40_BOMMO|nr:putative transporter SVOPL isoform X1 [Bombyx mori]
MENKIGTVTEFVENRHKNPVDLDQALDVVGLGWYNFKYCLVLALFLIAAIIEPVGYSFIVPSAKCDLNMTDAQRGFISSVPYIGIVVASFPWGFLVDTKGRKRVIIYGSLAAGGFGVISGFMPELISFTVCKFITSLCLACPAAAPYSYIGEILPRRHRDIMLSITNALQITGSALVPLLGWLILPLDFRIDFGAYYFRSWRLLVIVYSLFFILAAFLLSFGPESPKYLVSQGQNEEALKILQTMYAKNKSKSPEDFPVKQLQVADGEREKISFLKSLQVQTMPLLKPPYLKWLFLNGFLLFGIFSVLNGLYMWVPDLLNRVLTGSQSGLTACQVIGQRFNETVSQDAVCIDTIDSITYIINSIASVSCAIIAVAVSSTVKFVGKKNLLIIIFCLIGVFCILINYITEDMLFAVLLSSVPIMGLGIGPVNAYAVEIFPTQLRGMAVSLSMMLGRTGSVVGTNVAGILLRAACEATFYLFGGLLLVCGGLTLLLPKSREEHKPKTSKITRL